MAERHRSSADLIGPRPTVGNGSFGGSNDAGSKTFTPAAHRYDALPFVLPPPTGGARRFWAPRSTGRYLFDCDLGGFYAKAALPFLRNPAPDADGLFIHMAMDMVLHADPDRDSGVIAGMFAEFQRALAAGMAGRV